MASNADLGSDEGQRERQHSQMRALFEVQDPETGEWKDNMKTTLFILFFVVINTVTDALTGAWPEQGSTEASVKFIVGFVCLIVFFVEMVLKMRIFGLLGEAGGNGYFRSNWCLLSFSHFSQSAQYVLEGMQAQMP